MLTPPGLLARMHAPKRVLEAWDVVLGDHHQGTNHALFDELSEGAPGLEEFYKRLLRRAEELGRQSRLF